MSRIPRHDADDCVELRAGAARRPAMHARGMLVAMGRACVLLLFVLACRSDGTARVESSEDAKPRVQASRVSQPDDGDDDDDDLCPFSSAYDVEPRFRIAEAAWRPATGGAVTRAPSDADGPGEATITPGTLVVTLANELDDGVTVLTLVVRRRVGGICGPPTGERVTPAMTLAPGEADETTAAVGDWASDAEQPEATAMSISVTATTAAGRRIRTPPVVLTLR